MLNTRKKTNWHSSVQATSFKMQDVSRNASQATTSFVYKGLNCGRQRLSLKGAPLQLLYHCITAERSVFD